MPWVKGLDALAGLRKDMVASDVHITQAGGAGQAAAPGKPKKKKPDDETKQTAGAPGHLPVTSMTLAAQQITGQAKPAIGKYAQVLKVDETYGLVLGWAIVCKTMPPPPMYDMQDYYDLQNDHIPESSMLAATVDFMQHSRATKEMHAGDATGSVLFAFPLTTDIAKAFGVQTKTTGLMIAMKPDSAETLGKFRDGTYTGFSIGGWRLEDEEVA